MDLIFRDSVRFLGLFVTPNWQVPNSLKCDLRPPPPGKGPNVSDLKSNCSLVSVEIGANRIVFVETMILFPGQNDCSEFLLSLQTVINT